jgi:hypothetical protein
MVPHKYKPAVNLLLFAPSMLLSLLLLSLAIQLSLLILLPQIGLASTIT